MTYKVEVFRSGCGHTPDDAVFEYCPVCHIAQLEEQVARVLKLADEYLDYPYGSRVKFARQIRKAIGGNDG